MVVTGNITVTGGNTNTKVAFKNCAPFRRCVTHINDEHVETAENLDIIMPIYNLLEYGDNYVDSSGSLWQFKRDEQNMNGANLADVTIAGSLSFKCKPNFLKDLNSKNVAANANPNIVDAHRLFTNVKIAVPLKYLCNFFRSLEMPLTNCKTHLKPNWTKNCVMSTVGDNGNKTFQVTSTKLYVPIVTLSTKDNVSLTKQLNEGFKRSVYWNEYKSKIETKARNTVNDQNSRRFPLDASFQGVNRLFVLAFDNTTLDYCSNGPNKVRK